MKLTAEVFEALATPNQPLYSQTGEEWVLWRLFEALGITNGYLIDVGAEDGWHYSNTRLLINAGWDGVLFDADSHVGIAQEMFNDENVNEILDKYAVPIEPDLLALDIDGQDWWVWRALTRRPKVVVVEVNGNVPAEPPLTIPRYPPHRWDRTLYYGANFGAFVRLGHAKGYTLVHNQSNLNLFFLRSDFVEPGFSIVVPFQQSVGHPPDDLNREWHNVTDTDLVDVPGGPLVKVAP